MDFIFVLPLIVLGVLFALSVVIAMAYRTVVSTNDVHIVQSAAKTVSYGKGETAGNVYYKWPAWIPIIGIKVIKLPVSVFDVRLESYSAYDKGRVPFEIDIMAFFRIEDPNTAAQRVHSFDEMREQLAGILQGACRSILAKSEIEEILEERPKFGGMFTDATTEQLKEWGVGNVKDIELMDIRDRDGSKVIANIMAKKQSLIARESRVAIAENDRAAQEAEIIAQREVLLRKQEAERDVGMRTAEKEKAVGISRQQAHQEIKEQEAITATKDMAVKQVQIVRAAEIKRDEEIVHAEQKRSVAIIEADAEQQAMVKIAEGNKQQTIIVAAGDLEKSLRHADGVRAEGLAAAEAETAKQLASVTAQTTLAEKVGENIGYQQYLAAIEQIKVAGTVGVAQAKALENADVKLILTDGGIKNAGDLLSAKGGSQIGAMLEGFAQTDLGASILSKLATPAQKVLPAAE